jgi:RES domain-containing protein
LSTLKTIARRLAGVSCVPFRAVLARRVPLLSLIRISPPDFLHTSGKPGRYNPAGVLCVYFGEDEDTARLEYERLWVGTPAQKQPVGLYFARIRLTKVLDLTSAATLKKLKLLNADLHRSWRGVKPIKTQKLGLAVSTQTAICAVRYPSDAAAASGKAGTNLVIFRNRVVAPDYVQILGPDKRPLQAWP